MQDKTKGFFISIIAFVISSVINMVYVIQVGLFRLLLIEKIAATSYFVEFILRFVVHIVVFILMNYLLSLIFRKNDYVRKGIKYGYWLIVLITLYYIGEIILTGL